MDRRILNINTNGPAVKLAVVLCMSTSCVVRSVGFLFTEPGLCMNTGLFFSAHTKRTARCRIADYIF